MRHFDEARFISENITKRSHSLFSKDIEDNYGILSSEIENKNVLVIGGAGTIGSSFIKCILKFRPSSLVVVDYSENELTELTRDLRSDFNEYMPDEYITYPFDFGGDIFYKLLDNRHFDIVACFAAHKHVRSEKDPLAIEAMFKNNIKNTYHLLKKLLDNKPNHFFSVSTDKASNPVNIMGATKLLMEKVLLAYSKEMKITTARFANVAFSNGSLLYGFNRRIAKRQPISSPSDVKRYFVSPEESGQICTLGCILGESSDIIFPKLDAKKMKTFSEIAEKYLLSLGMEPDYCSSEKEARAKAKVWDESQRKYPVYFFRTDTSGEKPYEEFYSVDDTIDNHRFEALGVIKNSAISSDEEVGRMLKDFEDLFDKKDINKKDIVTLINRYIPNFNHIETGKNLDQKM